MKYFSLALVLLSTSLLNTVYAADKMPEFDCVLTDQILADKQPGGPKDTFIKTTPAIYFVCESSDLHKGQSIRSVWIADDTYHVAPANYEIDEKTIQIDKELGKEQIYTANFSLSKPTKGWPAGKYHVDLYVNKQLVKSAKFTVK